MGLSRLLQSCDMCAGISVGLKDLMPRDAIPSAAKKQTRRCLAGLSDQQYLTGFPPRLPLPTAQILFRQSQP